MRISTFLKRTVWSGAVLLLLMLSNVGFAQQSTTNYLKKFKPVSVEIMQETGIPASVILGIAMLESGTGTSRNAKLLHNHFGIVGKNDLAKTKSGHRSVYKQYVTDLASYEHFAELLASKKWFGQMKGNPEFSAWLKKMNHSGYSSAGHEWIRRVTNIINRYKLYKLDANMDSVATDSKQWLTVGMPPTGEQ
ncbi:glucosaminidase domain-containing protein [Chitinophaga eiseniae]|uniref:Glucosaminidase domain-containing protein n=1 Tax=Chitinophaga eiseniae TaxID=634771 RepID=A0A847S9K5_9BACT|nr:glucosaminidase domain-containing protein [Chitinophaga eiseniae]NLR78481.1 glucosaminidase domain-containing protein [Chitinophaga eiseniae]